MGATVMPEGNGVSADYAIIPFNAAFFNAVRLRADLLKFLR
jgi:hypothetical protein